MRAPSRSDAWLLALALAGGSVDATSYIGLGKVFTANMTGNTVLLAVALVQGTGADAARAVVALGGFCIGVAIGVTLIAAAKMPWPRRARDTLLFETLSLVLLLVLWATIGVHSLRYGLIALAGLAMGAQSAAVRSSDVRGVNTTYMTSTLLNAIAGLVQRRRPGAAASEPGPTLPAAAWLTYGIGAVIGAFVVHSRHAAAVAIPLAIVAAIAAGAGRIAQPQA